MERRSRGRKRPRRSWSRSRNCCLSNKEARSATWFRGEKDSAASSRRSRLRNSGSRPVLFGEAAEGGVEAGVERLLQRLRRQARRFLAVVREVHEPGDQRPRVRAAQRLLAVKVVE